MLVSAIHTVLHLSYTIPAVPTFQRRFMYHNNIQSYSASRGHAEKFQRLLPKNDGPMTMTGPLLKLVRELGQQIPACPELDHGTL
jgi:hypothetical protein